MLKLSRFVAEKRPEETNPDTAEGTLPCKNCRATTGNENKNKTTPANKASEEHGRLFRAIDLIVFTYFLTGAEKSKRFLCQKAIF